MGDIGVQGDGGFDWEAAEDVTALSDTRLRAQLEALAEQERALGYRLRIAQGRMDVVRAELVRRGGVSASSEELARVLLGGREGGS